jgi:16S rRNA (uracil1498-N3)-methyltransferase
MVEPLFRKEFPVAPKPGDVVELGGDEGKHAASVRRMRVGEGIQLTDGRGLRVRGQVAEVLPKSLKISVTGSENESKDQLELVLVQALAKGDRDELAIQAATELGVSAVISWQAERSISRWDAAKAAKGQARWQVICDEAAKQSLRVWHPRVEPLVTSQELTARIGEFAQVLVLDPTAEVGIASVSVKPGKIAIVVGPEGGIDETELAAFEKAGALRVRLGEPILRTSTAGVVAIAAIQTVSGYFN